MPPTMTTVDASAPPAENTCDLIVPIIIAALALAIVVFIIVLPSFLS